MKKIIISSLLLHLMIGSIYGQLYNDGAQVIIQPDALLHIQGDFINQGGEINNQGLIEIGGNWENTVMELPLTPGAGSVHLVGTNQVFGGISPTLFNNVLLQDNQNVSLTSTMGIGNTIDINNGLLELNRNTLHILNSADTALVSTTGGVIAETFDIYGFVRWDIGEGSTGSYSIPFKNSFDSTLPLTYDITGQGEGADGYLLFTTVGTLKDNTPLPIDVTNVDINGDGSGINLVDRFWVITTEDYTSDPSATVGFSFDEPNEIAGTNEIEISKLETFHYDEDLQAWNSLVDHSVDGNTVSSPITNTYGNFILWSNTTTSVDDFTPFDNLNLYPNPADDNVTIQIQGEGSEEMQLMIIDAQGRIVNHSLIKNHSTNTTLDVNVKDLDAGLYTVIVTGESRRGIIKLNKI